MADVKISALPAAGALAGTEVLPVVQSGATAKATVTQVLAAAQPLDSDLTAIAALSTTAYGRALLALANAAALTAGIDAATTTLPGISELATSAETVTGTDTTRTVTPAGAAAAFQPLDADLTSIAALATTSYGRSLLTLASLAAQQAALKTPVPLFDHFASVGNIGTGVDTLYLDTIAAGQLSANGDKLLVEYAVTWLAHATATRANVISFGGTTVLDTTPTSAPDGVTWNFDTTFIRVSASVVRYTIVAARMTDVGVGTLLTTTGEITGLTLANTQALLLTGEAAGVGAATNDVIAKTGTVIYVPAA